MHKSSPDSGRKCCKYDVNMLISVRLDELSILKSGIQPHNIGIASKSSALEFRVILARAPLSGNALLLTSVRESYVKATNVKEIPGRP